MDGGARGGHNLSFEVDLGAVSTSENLMRDDPGVSPLSVMFWGTRGSIPAPGPATLRFGGNTACLEVVAKGAHHYIFDAGTGIRGLGHELLATGPTVEVDIFLTHFHWDHIQGIPFFGPLQRPDARIRIHAPPQESGSPADLLEAQMAGAFFPVPFSGLPAQISLLEAGRAPWSDGIVTVDSLRAHHPSNTVGYRVRSGSATLIYFPDNELHRMRAGGDGRRYHELVDFCRGADLLVHDSMYTEAEYAEREGWGHSTFHQALALAEDAGVKRLRWFHHAPERSDAEITSIMSALQDEAARRNCRAEVAAAFEGEMLHLGG